VEHDLPNLTPSIVEQMDFETVMKALLEIDESYRAPLLLFYFEDFSYKQIAETLGVPPGTVMSRLARGKEMLRRLLTETARQNKVIPLLRQENE
jgi:RNA polymerase sigma-70 factor (ECF subfamily)